MDQVDGFECICPEQWVGATCQLGKGSLGAVCAWVVAAHATVAAAAAGTAGAAGARCRAQWVSGARAPQLPCLIHRRQ